MVETRRSDLPDFDNPPVVETVLSVQFDRLENMRVAHVGLLWPEYMKRYPQTEERPPLDPVVEKFPESAPAPLGLQLQTYENLPIPRLWFLNEKGTELLQVQPDRFIKNWRKVGQGDEYPRYEQNKELFERDFETFKQFVVSHNLGQVRIRQCEVTYVNHILAGEGWSTYQDVDEIFMVWRNPAEPIPGRATDLALRTRFVIASQSGEPVGRLHLDISPAIRNSDGRPMYVMNLTARGQLGEGFEFLDLGRRWIVKSFAELTTPRMHQIWRRKDNANF